MRTFRLIISYSQEQKPQTAFEKKQLCGLREQIRATFEELGLPVKVWSAEDLLQRLDEILNVSESLAWNPFEPLSHQMMRLDTHLRVMPEGLPFDQGKFSLRTYSVQFYPCNGIWRDGQLHRGCEG